MMALKCGFSRSKIAKYLTFHPSVSDGWGKVREALNDRTVKSALTIALMWFLFVSNAGIAALYYCLLPDFQGRVPDDLTSYGWYLCAASAVLSVCCRLAVGQAESIFRFKKEIEEQKAKLFDHVFYDFDQASDIICNLLDMLSYVGVFSVEKLRNRLALYTEDQEVLMETHSETEVAFICERIVGEVSKVIMNDMETKLWEVGDKAELRREFERRAMNWLYSQEAVVPDTEHAA